MKLGKLIQTVAITTTLLLPTVKIEAVEISSPWLENQFNSGVEISLNLPAAPTREGSITTGTVGGGRRSPGNLCTNSNQPPLTVLMSNDVNHIEMSQNTNRRNSDLSLYWYLPETNAQKAEFLILSKNGTFLYFQEFEIPQNTKGLVRLDLPNNIPFEENTLYKWELALVCQEFDRSSDEYTWGAIEPLGDSQEQELNRELESARNNPSGENASSTDEAIANVYIRHNLWHKAVSVLLEPYSSNNSTDNISQTPLVELLDYFGLEQQSNLIGVVNEDGFRMID